jgi:hypothetical protein
MWTRIFLAVFLSLSIAESVFPQAKKERKEKESFKLTSLVSFLLSEYQAGSYK